MMIINRRGSPKIFPSVLRYKDSTAFSLTIPNTSIPAGKNSKPKPEAARNRTMARKAPNNARCDDGIGKETRSYAASIAPLTKAMNITMRSEMNVLPPERTKTAALIRKHGPSAART